MLHWLQAEGLKPTAVTYTTLYNAAARNQHADMALLLTVSEPASGSCSLGLRSPRAQAHTAGPRGLPHQLATTRGPCGPCAAAHSRLTLL